MRELRSPGYDDASTFEEIIVRAVALDGHADDWTLQQDLNGDDAWIRVLNKSRPLPSQGWKLHLAAYTADSHEVLSRSLPVLIAAGMTFKVAKDPQTLNELNLGRGGRTQVGKFITVYAAESEDLVKVAEQLADKTKSFDGPLVVTDRRIPGSRTVSYRYGSFGGTMMRTPLGDYVPALHTLGGDRIADTAPSFRPPPGVADPFQRLGPADDVSSATPTTLMGDRFLLITPIQSTERGRLFLALDTARLTRCVVKINETAEIAFRRGYSSVDLLEHEYRVLRDLAATRVGPAPIEFRRMAQGAYLAMEDLSGKTLAATVNARANRLELIPQHEAVELIAKIADLVMKIHESGYVFRDLKSSNIILGDNGAIRLVDFELAHALSDERAPRGRGTAGYMSPQQQSDAPPSVSDDVYALGALLWFVLTAAEPSSAPRPDQLHDRPLATLRPGINLALESVIRRALQPERSLRFSSAEEFRSALTLGAGALSVRPRLAAPPPKPTEVGLMQVVRRAGIAIGAAGQSMPGGGRAWFTKRARSPRSVPSRDLGSGTAGVALTLASLFSEVQEEELGFFAAAGCQWLIGKSPVEDHPLPGLFVGEAGVCLALVRIGASLGDEELIEEGRRRALEVASAPHDSPDIYHGTAGRILVHLAVWEQCGDGEQLDAAVHGGEFLLRTAEQIDGVGTAWMIPPGYSSLSGERWLGFAHGAAGVGYALIRLYEATGDARFRAAARGVADLLVRHAVGPSVSQFGLSWPTSAGRELASPVWCHGSGGVGRFFLAAAAADIFSGAMELAQGCASAVAASRWLGPTKCHGLAGGIEYLLDIRDATGIPSYADEARNFGDLLTAFIVEDEARGPWPAEAGQWLPADLMVGYSGIALSLLRLSGDRPAHVLLRDV